MTLAHVSDTWIGFRAYEGTTLQGINQREEDVIAAFERVLKTIGERNPDVVVHSGNVFSDRRPSNASVVRAVHAVAELQRQREGKPLIVVGGRSDVPQTQDGVSLIRLMQPLPGVIVVPTGELSVDLPRLDLEIRAVSAHALRGRKAEGYEPQTSRKHALLVLGGDPEEPFSELNLGSTRHSVWTYVALGGRPDYQPLGPNISYAGSLERVSTDPWSEAQTEKGWVWFDYARGMSFEPVTTRRIIDLETIDAEGITKAGLDALLRQNAVWKEVGPADVKPIVRQRIVNLSPRWVPHVYGPVTAEIRARCLHYELDIVPNCAPLQTLTEELQDLNRRSNPAESPSQAALERLKEALPGGV